MSLHCSNHTKNYKIFDKNVKAIDARKDNFYKKIGNFAKKCVGSSGGKSTEAFRIILLWRIDTYMVMMHVSIDFWLMQSWRHSGPSYKVCYFALCKIVRGRNSWSNHRIGMKLQDTVDYDISLRFMLMKLTFHKGRGHMTFKGQILKIFIFHQIFNLHQISFLYMKEHHIFGIVWKFQNCRSKIKAVIALQMPLPSHIRFLCWPRRVITSL